MSFIKSEGVPRIKWDIFIRFVNCCLTTSGVYFSDFIVNKSNVVFKSYICVVRPDNIHILFYDHNILRFSLCSTVKWIQSSPPGLVPQFLFSWSWSSSRDLRILVSFIFKNVYLGHCPWIKILNGVNINIIESLSFSLRVLIMLMLRVLLNFLFVYISFACFGHHVS